MNSGEGGTFFKRIEPAYPAQKRSEGLTLFGSQAGEGFDEDQTRGSGAIGIEMVQMVKNIPRELAVECALLDEVPLGRASQLVPHLVKLESK